MKLSFGSIFGESFKEYKRDWWAMAKVLFLFYAIPYFVFFLWNLISDYSSSGLWAINMAVSGVILVAFMLIYFYGSGVLISGVTANKKFNSKSAKKGFRGMYWAFLGFCVVVSLFLTGLYILLIIPGIIFTVYWSLSVFVFFGEKKGIIDSLRRSFKMVKGNWWRVLWYTILIMLVMVLIYAVLGIVFGMVGVFVPDSAYLVAQVLWFVFDVLGTLLTVPLMLLFYKNLYMVLKKKK